MGKRATKPKNEAPAPAPPSTSAQPRLEWVLAADLRAKKNPRNWRKHPKRQAKAMKAALAELGWLKPVIFNERTGRMIDGHMRIDAVPPKSLVPVFIVDLDEEKERTALLTVDAIGSMAEADAALLNALLSDTPAMTANDGLSSVHEHLHALWALKSTETPADKAGSKDAPADPTDPNAAGAGATFQILATCKDEPDQARVYKLLQEAGVECRVLTQY